MFEVEITTGFSAAHQLRDYKGKCERLHGHNYKVNVVAGADQPAEGGMVIDFGKLKSAAGEVMEMLDHYFLNDVPPFDKIEPSAENLALFIFQEVEKRLGESGELLRRVAVWESDTSKATYFGR